MQTILKLIFLLVSSACFTGLTIILTSLALGARVEERLLSTATETPLAVIFICMLLVTAAFINDFFFWLAVRFHDARFQFFPQVPLGSGPEGAIGSLIQPLTLRQKLKAVYPILLSMMFIAYFLVQPRS